MKPETLEEKSKPWSSPQYIYQTPIYWKQKWSTISTLTLNQTLRWSKRPNREILKKNNVPKRTTRQFHQMNWLQKRKFREAYSTVTSFRQPKALRRTQGQGFANNVDLSFLRGLRICSMDNLSASFVRSAQKKPMWRSLVVGSSEAPARGCSSLRTAPKPCMVIKPTKIAFAWSETLKCGKGNEEKLSHRARTQTEDWRIWTFNLRSSRFKFKLWSNCFTTVTYFYNRRLYN